MAKKAAAHERRGPALQPSQNLKEGCSRDATQRPWYAESNRRVQTKDPNEGSNPRQHADPRP